MDDSSKTLVVLQQAFIELAEMNSLLTNVQSTLLPLSEVLVELRAHQVNVDVDQMKADFADKCDAHFEEIKKERVKRRKELSDALSEQLYGKQAAEGPEPAL